MNGLVAKINFRLAEFAILDYFMRLWSFKQIKFGLVDLQKSFPPTLTKEITCKYAF